eukprot:2174908-Rhodomonas_salina.1
MSTFRYSDLSSNPIDTYAPVRARTSPGWISAAGGQLYLRGKHPPCRQHAAAQTAPSAQAHPNASAPKRIPGTG